MKRTVGFVVWALALVTLSNCATRVAGLKQSDSFVYANVIKGKVLIGGVTSVVDQLDELHRNSLSNLLRTEILEERHDFHVTPVGMLSSHMGAKYKSMLEQYRNEGVLSRNWIKALKQNANGHRYVVFARIENDQISHDRYENHNTNDKGERIPGTGRVTTYTNRTVSVSMNIYDLQAGEVSFSGTVNKTVRNSKEYAVHEEMGLVTIVKAFKGTAEASDLEKYPYPGAPEMAKVLEKAFNGFGENLPKKP